MGEAANSQTGSSPPGGPAILAVEGLKTFFHTRQGVVRAVDGVSYDLKKGETLGVVGESGCGKTVTALSILRLVPFPPGKIEAGRVLLGGRDLLALSEREMQSVRGNDISMIFQEPMTSLNPVLTIGHQIGEAIVLHQRLSKKAALEKSLEMLHLVNISEPRRRVKEYPHQLSGGMRQRVMIAMALSCNPRVLIADEPTTALDVTIQAQILELILEMQQKLDTAVILITHDLGVIAETAQRVVVMYAGKKVEEAPVEELFGNPLHPYTHGLLASVPRLAAGSRAGGRGRAGTRAGAGGRRLAEIPGIVPSLHDLPGGCAFAPRCAHADNRCLAETPPLEEVQPGHPAACWHSAKLYGGTGG